MDEPKCYSSLIKFMLSNEDLERNNFPRPHPFMKSKALIFDLQNSYFSIIPGPDQRICKRCSKVYVINSEGLPFVLEECYYHPFKFRKGRFPMYPCCRGAAEAPPCLRAPFHITRDIDPNNLDGFITTRRNKKNNKRSVYAIDCEMVCTKAGLEIASISIVDPNCDLVYEAMILPDNPVHDYLTEYSRLTKMSFTGVTMRLSDLHEKLLELFGEQTILVGHGLCSDLLYLKLIHDNIVDTMVLYGKQMSFVPSLAVLKKRFLPPEESSNSIFKCREDAKAAMKLTLLKCPGIYGQQQFTPNGS